MSKLTVAIVCGGRSGEHEISLLSAYSVFHHIDRTKYEPIWLGITPEGQFVSHPELILQPESPRTVHLNPAATIVHRDFSTLPIPPDIIFPVLHGSFGEDGCFQGFANTLDVPFVGADVFASALSMNKAAAKKVMQHAGIPVTPFMEARVIDPYPNYADIAEKLGPVLFVKPNTLGSSVGVSKCRSEQTFTAALDDAFTYDNRVIIESYFPGREIEFAVMGNEAVEVSPPGEIIPDVDFYSYDSKYDPNSRTKLIIPAEIEDGLLQKMTACAKLAYRSTECEGFCRIDFFLAKDDSFVINEINTIPGFTKISMFPALFHHFGYSYSDLISKLLTLGIERHKKNRRLQRTFIK